MAIHLQLGNGRTKTVLTEHQAEVYLAQGWHRIELVLEKPGLPVTQVLEDTSVPEPAKRAPYKRRVGQKK